MKLVRNFDDTDSTLESSGGKGHNLIKMAKSGLNVPAAIIIPTEVCNEFRKSNPMEREELMDNVMNEVLDQLEVNVWSDSPHKLVSVRSGAPVSMPGMMDTVLNVGAGYEDADLSDHLRNDCRRRFVEMYADVVMNHDDKIGDAWPDWLASIQKHIPTLEEIIRNCVVAVFQSWDNERAIHYRKMNKISDEMGTAVVIQSMVFGNFNENSGSGVLFTRNPSTGAKMIMGEFLTDCQGEDVVAGTATPMQIAEMFDWNHHVANELFAIADKLEAVNKDMQDIEFTIQAGELFILQTRNGKRSPRAEIQIALDLLDEGVIKEFGERVKPGTFAKLRQPVLPEDFNLKPTGEGIPAGGYFVTGKAAFNVKQVLDAKEPVVLVADETTPDDIKGMERAVGILTRKGGATSHAAVVARGMNKTCVVGAGKDLPLVGSYYVLLDGQTGKVWASDEPFDIDLTSSVPVDLLEPLLEAVIEKTDWIRVESFAEAMSLASYIKRVGVPVIDLTVKQLKELSKTFERVVLINPDRRDRVSNFIGTPQPREMENARALDKAVIENDLNKVVFDSGDWQESNVAKPFKTMADVMDDDFVGYITEDFVKKVMGDKETFDKLSLQLGLSARVVEMESILSLLEKRIKIG